MTAESRGRPRQEAGCAGAATGSDETLVDVAPSPARSRLQASGDRVVGLLVVRPGVAVRRVIGTGHPATGQADHKSRLAVLVVLAARQSRHSSDRGLTGSRPYRFAVEV